MFYKRLPGRVNPVLLENDLLAPAECTVFPRGASCSLPYWFPAKAVCVPSVSLCGMSLLHEVITAWGLPSATVQKLEVWLSHPERGWSLTEPPDEAFYSIGEDHLVQAGLATVRERLSVLAKLKPAVDKRAPRFEGEGVGVQVPPNSWRNCCMGDRMYPILQLYLDKTKSVSEESDKDDEDSGQSLPEDPHARMQWDVVNGQMRLQPSSAAAGMPWIITLNWKEVQADNVCGGFWGPRLLMGREHFK
ncbi:hypothetical protein WJX72_007142 [[Myrmecia] bisecta]|uniref:Uncharacterized protein n=1 Tax=[Myrmecia] bisecta TaxID=41462 RepID=A0AAW1QRG0_9CHLO